MAETATPNQCNAPNQYKQRLLLLVSLSVDEFKTDLGSSPRDLLWRVKKGAEKRIVWDQT